MNTALRELGAELKTVDYGCGVRLPVLRFDCPDPACGMAPHSHVMPYSDAGTEARHETGQTILVWQRMSGSNVDDITLSPSFRVSGACEIHGHVVAGQWVPC